MARIDRSKRALGGAIKRTKPSRAATILVQRRLTIGRVLDYGCGHGLDARTYRWDGFDPYYRAVALAPPYDTIVCISVLNALSRKNGAKAIARIRALLAEGGRAYFAVRRDLPRKGKLGINHSLQNYVVLTLPSVYRDEQLEIYEMTKTVAFQDKTADFVSRRDKRKDR
jgi:hypothetical protein